MINIVLIERENFVEIEGNFYKISNINDVGKLICDILDKAYFSGETLCLEKKDIHGHYVEIKRW